MASLASRLGQSVCHRSHTITGTYLLPRTDAASIPIYLAPSLRSNLSTKARPGPPGRRLKQKAYQDAFTLRMIRERKDAALARKKVLQQERTAALGDPIYGVETPFVQSFDYEHLIVDTEAEKKKARQRAQQMQADAESHDSETAFPTSPAASSAYSTDPSHQYNHGMSPAELDTSLAKSRDLTEPLDVAATHSPLAQPFASDDASTRTMRGGVAGFKEQEDPQRKRKLWQNLDSNATEALRRIVNLSNANSADRTKANIARVIDTFGRHKTDEHLQPKAPSAAMMAQIAATEESTSTQVQKGRAGPDTGSSEVQIGILTTRIRVIAARYAAANRNDKFTKRTLRMLLHRRQKLLKYMYRRERGSARWQHMMEMLGLTDANWRGEISVQ